MEKQSLSPLWFLSLPSSLGNLDGLVTGMVHLEPRRIFFISWLWLGISWRRWGSAGGQKSQGLALLWLEFYPVCAGLFPGAKRAHSLTVNCHPTKSTISDYSQSPFKDIAPLCSLCQYPCAKVCMCVWVMGEGGTGNASIKGRIQV